MTHNEMKGDGKLWLIFIVLAPFLLYGLFYLYTKQARVDLSSMKYPDKMYSLGLDTIMEGTYKKVDTIYHEIPDFKFINQFGQEIHKGVLNDKILVVQFFSTQDDTVSAIMSSQMLRVQNSFLRDDKLMLLSISLDASNDSIPTLKTYSKKYEALPGKWQMLSGKQDELNKMLLDGFKMPKEYLELDTTLSQAFAASHFVLVDPEWNIRGYYAGTFEKDVNIMMGDILLLLEEFKR